MFYVVRDKFAFVCTCLLKMSKSIILISGPAGVGKTTICDKLVKEFSPHISRLVTATSRSPRVKEVDGVDYIFLSRDEFEKRISNEDFAEYEIIHGNYYGTLKKYLFETFSDQNLLINIDVNGAQSIQQIFREFAGMNSKLLTIFIRPKSIKELETRLITRGTDSHEQIKRRILTAQHEIEQAFMFDLIIDSTCKELDYNLVKNFYLKFTGQK
jgi:guanylate kinase